MSHPCPECNLMVVVKSVQRKPGTVRRYYYCNECQLNFATDEVVVRKHHRPSGVPVQPADSKA